MRYCSIDELDHFDLRDHNWQLTSRTAQDVTFRVPNLDILAGEYAGERIDTPYVTFRNFRLDWAKRLENESEIPLSFEAAMEYYEREPMLVFSYWTDGSCCEICGLGEQEVIAMVFTFDAATVEWDAFAKNPAGTLTKV